MESFGRYELHEQLGHGGMGIVYRAHDTVLQRVVALKLVGASYVDDPDMRERFFREARAAAQLTHKNIVTVYDLGEYEGRPYLAMEYLAGEDLQRRLSRPDKMSLARRMEIATEFCAGVEHAHEHGIVHRDLKPANIFLAENGAVKILDFGLARPMGSQLTQSNMLMGTINYMAPEQVRGERADQRSDIFSLGVVLYELFGGRRAFEGDSVASTLYKILEDVPQPLPSLDSEIPSSLWAVVERALAKNREDRYQHVSAVMGDLRQVANPAPLSVSGSPAATVAPTMRPETVARPASVPPQASVGPMPAPAGPPPKRRLAIIVGGVGILVLAAATTAWVMTHRARPAEPPSSAAVQPSPAQPAPPIPAPPATVTPVPPSASAPAADGAKTRGGDDGVVAAARQQAETARGRMTEGRTLAEAAGAPVRAAGAFRNAVRRAQDADRLFKAQNYGAAASRYYEASGLFRDAEAAARTAAQAPRPTPSPVPQTPQRPQQGASAPGTAVAIVPPPAPAPVSPQPSSSTAASPPPAPSPSRPTSPAPPQGPSDEERILELVNRYRDALESRSIDRVKGIWPSLAGAAESGLRNDFQHATRISVEISSPQVTVSGSTGRVVFLRHYSLDTVDGQHPQSRSEVTMDVRRAGGGWVIESVRFSPR